MEKAGAAGNLSLLREVTRAAIVVNQPKTGGSWTHQLAVPESAETFTHRGARREFELGG